MPEAILRPVIVLGPYKVYPVVPALKVLVLSWVQLPVAERVPAPPITTVGAEV